MKLLKNLLLLLIIFSVFTIQLYSQPTASFTASKTADCPPFKVTFTNNSTGLAPLKYTWDLGDGVTFTDTTKLNPEKIYSTPGDYLVKLTVTDKNGLTNESSTVIHVYFPPSANFTANKKGCAPLNVQFTDLSTQGSAAITQWHWDLRNGTILTGKTPAPYTYTSAGKYTVSLIVTDANNCSSSAEEKTDFIDVADKPSVAFIANPSSACKIPTSVQFTNNSTGAGNLTYLWNFGNSLTSTQKNPITPYNNYGTFNVKLKVTSDYGCADSLEIPAVTIGTVKAAGSVKQGTTTINNNDFVCAGDLDFTNSSTGTSNWYWDFGNGDFSYNEPSTQRLFTNPGTVTVKLVASPDNALCSDTAKWTFTIEKATADFTFTPSESCMAPQLGQFTNQSTNAVSYVWTFHDNSTQTTQNASFTYTEPLETDPYVVHQLESFPIELKATSQHGCISTAVKNFIINRPTALFAADKTKGCAPLTVNFTDNSLPSGNIALWEWNYGDNVKEATTQGTSSHSYTNPGTYEAKIVVTSKDNNACKDTSYNIEIKVGKLPSPDFTVSSSVVCPSNPVQITDLTPGSDSPDFWQYSVNGIGIPSCPDVKNPIWKFNSDTGKLSVTLTVGSNGCYATKTINNIVTNQGAVSAFEYNVNCKDSTYHFTSKAKGATSWQWDFGDGNTDNVTLNPTHKYSTAGDYKVKLIAYRNSCSDTAVQTVMVRFPSAKFTTASYNVCVNEPVSFVGKDSHTIFTQCRDKYIWDFRDSTSAIQTDRDSVKHTFTKRGNFKVKLTALYENGCTDTVVKNIRVFKPYARITSDKTAGCSPLDVQFTDASLPDTNPLTKWEWDFQDGSPQTFTIANQSIHYPFNYDGVYPVTLRVTDNMNCAGDTTINIETATPRSFFNPVGSSFLCANADTAKFAYEDQALDSVVWNFGDGTISRSLANPVSHLYKTENYFDVSLIVYKYGCASILNTVSACITTELADAHFTPSESVWNCYPKEITFTHDANMSPVTSGKWDFGYQGNTGDYSKVSAFSYNKRGNYPVKLSVETSWGCKSTYTDTIKIYGPDGNFTTDVSKACKGDPVTFNLKDTIDVKDFEWDMGEGKIVKGSPVQYRFSTVGDKTIKLILYGQLENCSPVISGVFPVEEVFASIGVQDTSVCTGKLTQLTNQSVGQTTFLWDLGNGTTTTENDPVIDFAPGVYYVKLTIANETGCKDTAIQAMLFSPSPEITLSRDTFLCRGQSTTLEANGGDIINWSPDKWISSTISNTVTATPDSSIWYKARAIFTSTGCYTDDSVKLTVQQVPTIYLTPVKDTSIFIGSDVTLTAISPGDVSFLWNPEQWLDCPTCSTTHSLPLDTITYTIRVKDNYDCFTVYKSVKIDVKDTVIFELPKAFTPGGTDINRIFKVHTIGVKQLVDFKIYNRWGNVVFQTNDLSVGWDGKYQGKDQPIDTYVYTITVESLKGNLYSKKGTVLLMR